MMSCRYHTDQTDNDINSQVTDQSILEIAATAIAAGSTMMAGPASFVVCSAG